MTKPAVEFEISANELRLVYRPRDDTNWVRERFERGDGLVVKGTCLCRRDFDVGSVPVSLRWHCRSTALPLG